MDPDSTGGARWVGAYDWSQNGVAYLALGSASLGSSQLVIRSTAGTPVTVTLPEVLGGGEGSVQFAPDGNSVLVVDTMLGFMQSTAQGQSPVQVRRLDGTVRFSAPWDGEDASMPSDAVWGTDGRLYFWDSQGVSVANLSSGVTKTLLAGVRWYSPSVSPDGRFIVFAVRDAQGIPRLELLDTGTGSVVSGFGISSASNAVFVSPTLIWYHQEPACSGDACKRTGWATELGGQTTQVLDPLLSYDLSTHSGGPVGLSGVVTDSRVLPAS